MLRLLDLYPRAQIGAKVAGSVGPLDSGHPVLAPQYQLRCIQVPFKLDA
jgi:hypothetical protein